MIDTKTILIIDCFLTNESLKNKLIRCIDRFKKRGLDILLISNSNIPDDIIKTVDYYFYNKNNILFNNKYDNLKSVDFWLGNDKFELHEISKGFQRHGLSVLINIFNSIKLSKSLGYEYFHRIEVDDLYSDKGLDFICDSKSLCLENNKKSMFYFNENNDISFHYFISEIDFFLEKINCLTYEEDYKNFLKNNGFNNDFLTAEEYIFHNLKINGDDLVLKKSGSHDMDNDFYGTIWNTETSESSLSHVINGTSTLIFKILDKEKNENINFRTILTRNFRNNTKERTIILHKRDKSTSTLFQSVENINSWSFNIVPNDFIKIDVYENNILIDEIENNDIEHYIIFK